LRDRLREPEEAAKNAEIRQEGERGGEGEKGAAMFCVKEAARGSSELSDIAIARHHFDVALFLMIAAHAMDTTPESLAVRRHWLIGRHEEDPYGAPACSCVVILHAN